MVSGLVVLENITALGLTGKWEVRQDCEYMLIGTEVPPDLRTIKN